jgi:hypothetical protein
VDQQIIANLRKDLTVKNLLLILCLFVFAAPLLSAQSPDFSISVSPSEQELPAPSSVSFNVTVTPLNGFSGTVNLSLDTSGLPSTVTASISPISIAGSGSATLTIHANRASKDGFYTVYVIGTNGTVSHMAPASVNVEALVLCCQ